MSAEFAVSHLLRNSVEKMGKQTQNGDDVVSQKRNSINIDVIKNGIFEYVISGWIRENVWKRTRGRRWIRLS